VTSIFIDGEAGTTGLGIRERLTHLPVERLSIAEADRKNPSARLALMARADIVILCLPDEAARAAVALAETLGAGAPRLLDASSAHRTAPCWVYGYPELSAVQSARIARARLVSNPGCYATGAIALLRPLVDAGLIPSDHPLAINAVSGYSGGGRQMIEAHLREGGPAFELYGLGMDHKHIVEIQAHGGLTRRPIFVPSVGHFAQGMLVSIPLLLDTLPGCIMPAVSMCLWPTITTSAGYSQRLSMAPTGWSCMSLPMTLMVTQFWWRGSTISARAHPARRSKIYV
jgi:N-acetyl-gamma-glutamyl-phosphate reductase